MFSVWASSHLNPKQTFSCTCASRQHRTCTVECLKSNSSRWLFQLLQCCGATPPTARARPSAWAPDPLNQTPSLQTHFTGQHWSVSLTPSSRFLSNFFFFLLSVNKPNKSLISYTCKCHVSVIRIWSYRVWKINLFSLCLSLFFWPHWQFFFFFHVLNIRNWSELGEFVLKKKWGHKKELIQWKNKFIFWTLLDYISSYFNHKCT